VIRREVFRNIEITSGECKITTGISVEEETKKLFTFHPQPPKKLQSFISRE
jgi:hypothetical protein